MGSIGGADSPTLIIFFNYTYCLHKQIKSENNEDATKGSIHR